METKKNQRMDVGLKSSLYFTVGLCMAMFLVYLALEWKSYPQESEWAINRLNPDMIDEEVPPLLMQKLPEPQKVPIKTPPVIEIYDDDEKVIETVIADTQVDPDTEIAPIGDIAMDDGVESVPFVLIENAPVFPGCEREKSEEDRRECFQEMIMKHIKKHFEYPELAQELGLEGRVNTMFTIMEDGSLGELKMRGPHESLEAESARILSRLPKMTPGKQRGRTVRVSYSIPIIFRLQ